MREAKRDGMCDLHLVHGFKLLYFPNKSKAALIVLFFCHATAQSYTMNVGTANNNIQGVGISQFIYASMRTLP